MAWIALANLDRGEAGGGTGFVIPHPEHLGHPAGLERAPDLRRSGDALEQAGFIHRLVLWRVGKDGIITVEDRLDVDEGALLRVVGVVAHPLPEWPFRPDLPGDGLAFDGDFTVGRDRKAGIWAAHHVDRPATQAAGDVHLADLGQRARG